MAPINDESMFSDRQWIEENNTGPHWASLLFFFIVLFLIPVLMKWIFL